MPKGGAERAQHAIEEGTDRARQLGTNLREGTLEPNLRQFRDFYMQAVPQQMGDYTRTMQGYQNFADTGGFSPTDISNIRARATSPTRSVYDRAMQGTQRQQALQGGYSPGAGVLRSRMARDMATGLSDASRATEADIAQMVQQGKLAGLSGAGSLYGTTPGMANMFGNQVLGATGQLLSGVQGEADRELGFMGARINQGNMMGRGQHAFQNILQGAQAGAGAIYPWLAGGGGAMAPQNTAFAGGNFPTSPNVRNPQAPWLG
jgi:hypothetical protein